MGIDQFLGVSGSKYLDSVSFSKQNYKVTTFRDDQYIQQLNYLLHLELGANGYYKTFQDLEQKLFLKLASHHLGNARNLRKLILSCGGIADFTDTNVIPIEICFLLAKLGRQLGRDLAFDTTLRICEPLERYIQKKYINLLSKAPCKDKLPLKAGLFMTQANLIALKQRRL